jgi:uroporphyrinogen-III decarboxylase
MNCTTCGKPVTDKQWDTVVRVVRGETVDPLPAGFIIDSPWLPSWHGCRMIDYFSSDEQWLEANLHAVRTFPDTIFFPGFWSEFGMCTEPSAFGARCSFPEDAFPHANPLSASFDEIGDVHIPDPRTDGLLPFVVNRLRRASPALERAGHRIRFAVARGPLNVASHLVGMTPFLAAMAEQPEAVHTLLEKITAFLSDWLELQRTVFPSIDGILLLDDVIGFISEGMFREFALPYFQRLYTADVAVRFLHNDAPCRASAPYLEQMHVNLFNMGFDITLRDLRALAGENVTFLGNIPPRDVLAAGTPDDVRRAVTGILASLPARQRIILSCGGGMPPGVSTENLRAFMSAAGGV